MILDLRLMKFMDMCNKESFYRILTFYIEFNFYNQN